MDAFRVAHAAGADWQSATGACLAALGAIDSSVNLGFLYATDHLAADVPRILERLREGTGVSDWVGTVGIGIAANSGSGAPVGAQGGDRLAEHYDRPALAVMLASMPADSYRIFEPVHGGAQVLRERHGDWLERRQPAFGVVHADPRNPLTAEIVAGIARQSGAYLVGGLTSSRAGFPQVAERAVEGGVSGVLFSDALAVLTGLSQGCAPIGPLHTITDAEAHVVKTLDDKPALDVFKAEIGELLSRNLRRVAGTIFVALPVRGTDTGDYLVRNLVSIDPGEGSLGIAAEIQTGDPLMFVRRDRVGAEADLKHMLAHLAKRADRPIKGALYHCCVARGPNLFGDNAEELKLIASVIGDVPLVGFLANGEICNDRLYGYTGVLTLFL
jgi:small ligand-binding sensory domain FIST